MDNPNSGSITSEKFSCEKIVVKRKCKYCDFMTDLRITLDDHFWRYHRTSQNNSRTDLKIKVYPCNCCDFTTYSVLVWRLHRNKCSYVPKDEIKCSESSYVSTRSGSPKQIIEENELDDNKLTLQTNNDCSEMFFSCKLCEYQSMYYDDFYRHCLNHNTVPKDIKRFKCGQCAYEANNTTLLKQHHSWSVNKRFWNFRVVQYISVKHAGEDRSEMFFSCKLCEYQSMYCDDFFKHCLNHHTVPGEDMTYHECGFCNYKSPVRDNLRKHIVACHRDPEEIKWFECDRCTYTSKHKRVLKRHIQIKHNRENLVQHKCDQCSFTTAYKSNLQTHIISRHTDSEEINWFECDQCGYKSKHKGNLKQHCLTHIRKSRMQLKCNECSFKADSKSSLRKHISTHHTNS